MKPHVRLFLLFLCTACGGGAADGAAATGACDLQVALDEQTAGGATDCGRATRAGGDNGGDGTAEACWAAAFDRREPFVVILERPSTTQGVIAEATVHDPNGRTLFLTQTTTREGDAGDVTAVECDGPYVVDELFGEQTDRNVMLCDELLPDGAAYTVCDADCPGETCDDFAIALPPA